MSDPLLDIGNLFRYSFEFFVYDPQNSPKDEPGVLKAVQNVHAMINKEVAAGTDPKNVFVCGFSQGGLSLSLSSRLSQRHT